MKRSNKIALVIIASVTLTSCGSGTQKTQRDVYTSREKCTEDWGETNCEDTSSSETGRYYMGPHYYIHGGYPYYFPRGRSVSTDPVRAEAVPRFRGGVGRPSSGAVHSVSSAVRRGGFGRMGRFGS